MFSGALEVDNIINKEERCAALRLSETRIYNMIRESKFYVITDVAEKYEVSTQTIRRRIKEGLIPRPVTWDMYGENTRKPLLWSKKVIDEEMKKYKIE